MYPGRELNPHDHYWPQDFKSCVSTNSTTRANQGTLLKKNPLSFGEGFRAGNETRTRDPDLGKVVLYQLSYSRLCFPKGTANLIAGFKIPTGRLDYADFCNTPSISSFSWRACSLSLENLMCRGTPFKSQIRPVQESALRMYQVMSISHQKNPWREAVS